ncbi:hypothetical protein BE221DRAFT_190413 [Ostreococcus tauri]|uniref:Uncharacterized protein n=1 Tax=Ostreococcus tauri TaxID=70448 RepID=A0A1Y5IEQ2_OSTTA|nr:hypothetical protein BE221DRAFT_190413 [Ostreococcus tauri]
MTARKRAAPSARRCARAGAVTSTSDAPAPASDADADAVTRLRESERIRDALRATLIDLKRRYESLELAHAGAETRRTIIKDADAAREVAVARQRASAERERRMKAEARAEAAERRAREAESDRGDRERRRSAALASGLGGCDARTLVGSETDARSEEAKALAAAMRELESLRRTCERQKKELAQARARLKRVDLGDEGGAVDDDGARAGVAPETTASEANQRSTPRRRARVKKSSAAASARVAASARAADAPADAPVVTTDVAESRPPPMPSIDEPWISRPPGLVAPLGGAPSVARRPVSATAVAPARKRQKPPGRSPAIANIARAVERTSRAFRAPH